jgi:hypothetical protein
LEAEADGLVDGGGHERQGNPGERISELESKSTNPPWREPDSGPCHEEH